MELTVQTIIIIGVLVLAVGYLVWYGIRRLRCRSASCTGCPVAKGCDKRDLTHDSESVTRQG